MAKTLRSKINAAVNFLGQITYINLIGRGPSLSTALQSALILKEAADVYAEGISGAQYRHEPLELLNENYRAIVFAAKGKTASLNITLRLDVVDESFFPLLAIVPLEILTCKIAQAKGIRPGELSKISKVTTRE
jgi:glucosamine--fructose-6-phosphate aminotransferase (isomerizing)